MAEYEEIINEKIAHAKSKREERRRKRRMKRAVISAVTAVCVLFGAAAYTGLHARTTAEGGNKADVREDKDGSMTGKIVVLHSNDVHGAIDGYAKMAQLKKDFEADGAEVIVADAGDFSSEDTGGDAFGAINGFMMMRLAGYDVATFGDAEFAQGYDKLRNDISGAKLRLICANVRKDDKDFLSPDYLCTASTGAKIGFIGLTAPAECEGLTFLSGKDMYDAAQSEADSLRDRGADTVIALSHLGAEESADGSSTELYDKVSGIDFVIDGRSHEAMTEGAKGEPIQSAGEGFAYIGVIVMDQSGRIEDHYLMSTEKLASDEGVQAETEKFKNHTNVSEISTDKTDEAATDVRTSTSADEKAEEAGDAETESTEKAGSTETAASGTDAGTAAEEPDKAGSDQAGLDEAEPDKADTDKAGSDKAEPAEAVRTEAAGTENGKAEAENVTGDINANAPQAEIAAEAATTIETDVMETPDTASQGDAKDALASLQDGKYEVVKGDCLWSSWSCLQVDPKELCNLLTAG